MIPQTGEMKIKNLHSEWTFTCKYLFHVWLRTVYLTVWSHFLKQLILSSFRGNLRIPLLSFSTFPSKKEEKNQGKNLVKFLTYKIICMLLCTYILSKTVSEIFHHDSFVCCLQLDVNLLGMRWNLLGTCKSWNIMWMRFILIDLIPNL